MDRQTIENIADIHMGKYSYFKKTFLKYFLYSSLAGFYCAVGMYFAHSAASMVYVENSGSMAYKLVIGIAFIFALTLIVFVGTDLFTGSVMTFSIGSWERKTTLSQGLALLITCYIANVTGGVLTGAFLSLTGGFNGTLGSLLLKSCEAKVNLSFLNIFFRAIMCNVLICISSIACAKTKNDLVKIVVIGWAVSSFVISGFEHSIANSGLLTMGYIINPEIISISKIMHNLIPATIGNLIGGILISAIYYYTAKDK